jgi:hypothetical protein
MSVSDVLSVARANRRARRERFAYRVCGLMGDRIDRRKRGNCASDDLAAFG